VNVDIPTYLSFFSGIGGLDLAVRLIAPEARCCGYVEIEVPAVGILAARMEDGSLDAAPVWSDIRTFPTELYRGRVAGAVFGFPCTDLSVAGKQAGLEGGTRSGLFYSAMRVVREVEYEVCSVADGIARGLDFTRHDQFRGLGNMVVPLSGALALLILLNRDTER
jgi:DNA (cytosine-5)-methyltransferase 1